MISLAEIAKALDCDFRGNGNLIFSSPAEPLIAKKDQIAIAIDKKFENQLFETKAKGAIISNLFDWKTTNLEGVVIAEKTKITLSKLTSLFQSLKSDKRSINDNSFIDSITFFSVILSNELVASSSINIFAPLYRALAIPSLCL